MPEGPLHSPLSPLASPDPLRPPVGEQRMVAPPRPLAAAGILPALADRLRALRGDPRVGAVAVIAVALAAGAFWFRSATATPSASVPTSIGGGEVAAAGPAAALDPTAATAAAGATTTTVPAQVVVHVAGAVRRPGVVTLPAGSRVVDAIDAAGGGLADSDLDRLNLAALLADAQRILVARVGDPPTEPDPGSGVTPEGGATGADGTAPDGPLDLNAATSAELEELPGIGPTLAAAIIEERDRRGGFTDVAQLQQVSGIGERRFAQIRDLVTV